MDQEIILSTIKVKDLISEITDLFTQAQSKSIPIAISDEWLTCAQVEDYFSISHQTRIDWTTKGILTAYKLGGRTYYRMDQLRKAPLRIEQISSPKTNSL